MSNLAISHFKDNSKGRCRELVLSYGVYSLPESEI